jgi:hypothetical protein
MLFPFLWRDNGKKVLSQLRYNPHVKANPGIKSENQCPHPSAKFRRPNLTQNLSPALNRRLYPG